MKRNLSIVILAFVSLMLFGCKPIASSDSRPSLPTHCKWDSRDTTYDCSLGPILPCDGSDEFVSCDLSKVDVRELKRFKQNNPDIEVVVE